MTDSHSSHAVSTASTRRSRARKIINVLTRHVRLDRCDLLDVGTGSGHIAAALAERALSVTSVNVSDERVERAGYRFVQVCDHRLPFPDASFDVVVSNHVIEHVPDQQGHLAEISRVLKPDGVVYLATPNRLAVVEPHFGIAFLSWLPSPLAQRYLAWRTGAHWDIYPLGSAALRRLTRRAFQTEDVTVEMLRHPTSYDLDIGGHMHGTLARLPRWFYRSVYAFIPSYVLLLRPVATDTAIRGHR